MENVFDATNERNNVIRRSSYDWSHMSSFTARFGYAYPIFSELVPPNSSLKIKADLGLQLMPMVFPVQTKMKARVSFFKVPLRTLWQDYKDYVGNFREGLEEPFLDFAASFDKMLGVGKLMDWLNVPVVAYGNLGTIATYNSDTSISPCCFAISVEGNDVNSLEVNAVPYDGKPDSGVYTTSNAAYFKLKLTASSGMGTAVTTPMAINSLLTKLPSVINLTSWSATSYKGYIHLVLSDGTKVTACPRVGTFSVERDNNVLRMYPEGTMIVAGLMMIDSPNWSFWLARAMIMVCIASMVIPVPVASRFL